jgi:predicted DNA-binding transcriptional regulator AlpA
MEHRMTHQKSAPAPAAQVDATPIRLLSKPEVLDRVGVTFPTIWKWMREGKFPRSRECGAKACWIESEVESWIAALPMREYKPPSAHRAKAVA